MLNNWMHIEEAAVVDRMPLDPRVADMAHQTVQYIALTSAEACFASSKVSSCFPQAKTLPGYQLGSRRYATGAREQGLEMLGSTAYHR